MNRSIIPVLCSFLLLSASLSSAVDVAKILGQHPDFSNFNDLLMKTGLTGELMSKTTITLLAIPNGAIGDLTSKPNDVVKSILTTHIVLDYYDPVKLQHLKDGTTKLTTMFQQSGKAVNDQGFLIVTNKDNAVVFGSAAKDAPRDSKLEKSVMSQPYNISILAISQPIVTPGIGAALAPGSAQPPSANAPKSMPPKAESPKAESPASKETEAPSKAPASSKSADSPSADSTPADAKSPSKHADSPPTDAQSPSPSPSSAEKVKVSFGLFVVLASMLAAY